MCQRCRNQRPWIIIVELAGEIEVARSLIVLLRHHVGPPQAQVSTRIEGIKTYCRAAEINGFSFSFSGAIDAGLRNVSNIVYLCKATVGRREVWRLPNGVAEKLFRAPPVV